MNSLPDVLQSDQQVVQLPLQQHEQLEDPESLMESPNMNQSSFMTFLSFFSISPLLPSVLVRLPLSPPFLFFQPNNFGS